MKQPTDLEAKLALLMSLAADDRAGPGEGGVRPLPPRLRNAGQSGALRPLNIRSVRMGTGDTTSLLRILMTNACSFNCHYCPMRRDRNLPRTLLKAEELVRIFLGAVRRGWCSGLFITTGIPGRPVAVMDELIKVLELLRERHRFTGYVHTKIVPGGEPAQVARLAQLANRVSVNLEAPCGEHLTRIAPEKRLTTALTSLELARGVVTRSKDAERAGRPRDPLHPGATAGMTVQFVVGATPDSDRTLISTVTDLYAKGGMHHSHFSAFRPIRETPMEETRATPALREQRLYQADHLIRDYGFAPDEIVYDERGNLPLARDPKVSWALASPDLFPLDVDRASYQELIRVPGIGRVAAERIVAGRRSTLIRGVTDLRRLGVITDRAAGFLTIRGRKLRSDRWAEQLGFWTPEEDVGAPQLLYEFSPGTFR
ncbi:MAG: radical SAM protein [Gemmatimonadales bacterium]|nr:radical SAM protein [Gemmatimonadales bacterium]